MARTEVIPIDKDETIQGLIQKIRSASAKKVIICATTRTPLLKNEINLRLLKFYSEEDDKELALVVKDRGVKKLAWRLGITVEDSLVKEAPESSHQQLPINFNIAAGPDLTEKTPEKTPEKAPPKSPTPSAFSGRRPSAGSTLRDHLAGEERITESARMEAVSTDDTKRSASFGGSPYQARPPRRNPPKGVSSRERSRTAPSPQVLSSGKLAITLLVILCSFLAGSYLLFKPRMTLIVYPTYRDWVFAVEGEIGLDFSDRDIVKNQLPIRLMEKQGQISYSLPTAGRKKVGHKAALGEVVFINTSATAIVAPKGTMVATQTGLTFVTTRNVVVPKKTTKYLLGVATGETYGQAVVEVEATEKGAIGNIKQQEIDKIVGQLAKSLQVVNMAPFTTGEDRYVSVVEEADILRAEMEARRQMNLEAIEEVKKLVGEEYIFLSDLVQIEVEKVNPDPPLGSESASVSVELIYRVKGAVLSKNALYKCLKHNLEENLPPDFSPVGNEIAVKSLKIRGKNLRRSEFYLQSSAKLQGRIDKRKIFQAVAGKTFEEARMVLTGFDELSATEFQDHQGNKRVPSQSYQVRLLVPSERR